MRAGADKRQAHPMTTASTMPESAKLPAAVVIAGAAICSDVRPVIRQSNGECGVDAPHVFDTTVLPPHPDKRCRCGKQTWKKAEAEMLKLRLETFAAAQPLGTPFVATEGMRASEGAFAAPPQTNDVTRHPNDKVSDPRRA